MDIDTTSLLVAAGVVVAVSGVTFILSTALGRNERYGRLWSIAFIAGMLETIATVVWGSSPNGWWAGPASNGALVLAIGLMWSGCREYNGRLALAWVPVVGSAAVTLGGLLEGPDAGYWAGAALSYVGIVVFAALAAIETVRGILRRSADARVLTLVFGIVSVYYSVRLVVFLAAGPTDTLFTVYFGTTTTTFIAVALVIVAAISMTAIQPPGGHAAARPSGDRRGMLIPGVIDATIFDEQAALWLGRARRAREEVVLLTLSVDGLSHINSAFGRDVGDQTIRTVGRIACENAPSAAIVGHAGGGRFRVLASAPTFGSPITIAERLQTALVETPPDVAKGLRAIASCGIACTDELGYDFATLAAASQDALAEATTSGRPGAIVLARASPEPRRS